MSSPTSRSKQKLEREGWLVAIVEKWNPHARIRQDMFGFVDLICVRGDDVLAIQTTSNSNVSARIAKIQALPAFNVWRASPYRRVIVHGWAKKGPRGKIKRWACREIEVTQATPSGTTETFTPHTKE